MCFLALIRIPYFHTSLNVKMQLDHSVYISEQLANHMIKYSCCRYFVTTPLNLKIFKLLWGAELLRLWISIAMLSTFQYCSGNTHNHNVSSIYIQTYNLTLSPSMYYTFIYKYRKHTSPNVNYFHVPRFHKQIQWNIQHAF